MPPRTPWLWASRWQLSLNQSGPARSVHPPMWRWLSLPLVGPWSGKPSLDSCITLCTDRVRIESPVLGVNRFTQDRADTMEEIGLCCVGAPRALVSWSCVPGHIKSEPIRREIRGGRARTTVDHVEGRIWIGTDRTHLWTTVDVDRALHVHLPKVCQRPRWGDSHKTPSAFTVRRAREGCRAIYSCVHIQEKTSLVPFPLRFESTEA